MHGDARAGGPPNDRYSCCHEQVWVVLPPGRLVSEETRKLGTGLIPVRETANLIVDEG